MAKHDDFRLIQLRLRRLDPTWYPAGKPIDDEWGPGMAFGVDAALDALEQQRGLPPFRADPAPTVVAPRVNGGGQKGLPSKFNFLFTTPLPPLMVRLGLETLGTLETPGTADNPVILGWADEVARGAPTAYNRWAADFYNEDSIPWCGLWMAAMAVRAAQGRAERMPPDKYLSALAWAKWGLPVEPQHAAVGDVMVLTRSGGGHVTMNVGMEKGEKRFFGLGANQSDAVTIAPFDMSRVAHVRRPAYNALPEGARRVILSAGGASSVDEQ